MAPALQKHILEQNFQLPTLPTSKEIVFMLV